MKDKIKKIMALFFTRQFLIFLVVGGINTLNGMIFPTLFSLFMNPNIAFVLSYVPSLTISYFLNSFITFQDHKPSFRKYGKFVVSYLPNFTIQFITFFVVFNFLHWHKLIAILISSAIGVPVTFIILKLFAFRKKEEHGAAPKA